MKVLFITGPHAVGKMTVGEELSQQLKLPLLFNHMTLDLVQPFLGWTSEMFMLSNEIRVRLFQEIVKQPDNVGIIASFVTYFDDPKDIERNNRFFEIFRKHNIEPYFIELEAELETRIIRNKDAHRLEKKPSKRNIAYSEKELKNHTLYYRLNSTKDEIKYERYYRLNTEHKTSKEVADSIINYFNF